MVLIVYFVNYTSLGGYSYTLTRAWIMIMVEYCWNSSHDLSSIGRIDRRNQKHKCLVLRLVGDSTIDVYLQSNSEVSINRTNLIFNEVSILDIPRFRNNIRGNNLQGEEIYKSIMHILPVTSSEESVWKTFRNAETCDENVDVRTFVNGIMESLSIYKPTFSYKIEKLKDN